MKRVYKIYILQIYVVKKHTMRTISWIAVNIIIEYK